MKLESHATPAKVTPEQRYAALHRAIERGMVSDTVWRELAEISHRLGHVDEARRCTERITNDTLRKALHSRLFERGGRPDSGTDTPGPGSHPGAPAASHAGGGRTDRRRGAAGPEPEGEDPWVEEPPLRDHLVDAVQFLFVQHMPWVCLVCTLAFPLVVGLGGFLSAGVSPIGLAAISALPGLCVLAVIAAMARTILIESSHGAIDPPELPDVRRMLGAAGRWALDGTVVLVGTAAPATIAWFLEAETTAVVGIAVVSALVAPMAFCLATLRGLKFLCSPLRLARAVARGGLSYLGLAASAWAIFALPALVALGVFGQPVWVQISAIGPASVLPAFLAARLLGTWLETRHRRLGDLLIRRASNAPRKARPTKTPPARQAAKAPAARQARKPARPRPVAPAETPPPRKIEGRGPGRPRLDDCPDLTQMPGAVTVSGRDRVRCGAAAKPS